MRHPGYLLFILALSVISLFTMGLVVFGKLTPEGRSVLEMADLCICFAFFVDFVVTLSQSRRKLRYLATWGWLDLVSCIPVVGPLRAARAARIVRILRILRGVRSARTILSLVLERRAQSAALAALVIAVMLVAFGSAAILQFEIAPESNIKGAGDALWWSTATLSTVGYGDRYPVTHEGRLIAVILMIAGVCLVGTLTGLVASWFLAPRSGNSRNEIEELRREIQGLRERLEDSELVKR